MREVRTYNPQPMSQITRCPSCATTFKVVADQLRISDGWVRCGQCKEVFHAASNLQVTPAEPLLPEWPTPPAQGPGAHQAPAPDNVVPAPAMEGAWPAAGGVKVWGSARSAVADAARDGAGAAADVGDATAEAAPSPSGLAETDPGTAASGPEVPAFLSASRRAQAAEAPAWNLEPLSPFGWRTRQEPPAAAPVDVPVDPPAAAAFTPLATTSAAPAAETAPMPVPPVRAAQAPPLPNASAPDSGGYELPFAELRDSGWPDDLELDGGNLPAASGHADGEPMAQVVEGAEAPWAADPLDTMVAMEAQAAADAGPILSARSVDEDDVSGAGLLRKADAGDGPGSSQAEPPPSSSDAHARAQTRAAHGATAPSVSSSTAEQEPGFIRVARRQAVWQRPAVRISLVSVVLLLAVFLALQMAVRERDRIAALYPQLRPALQAVCGALGCTLAPPRSIADVVIDSSSFTKGRTDGAFQLQLSLKNRSAMALAMPALELTLTDAQDQPVIRRVIRPDEMGAPAALAAHGEWTGTLPLTVQADAARVAGYRLLAFYP